MNQGIMNVPPPRNEPEYNYAPGSPERAAIIKEIERLRSSDPPEIPLLVGGREVRTGQLGQVRCPHDHGRVLATFHQAGPQEVAAAVEAAREAWREWSSWDWTDRLAVFLQAADLASTKYRFLLNAATMLNQSKTVHQAEIDAATELIDFYRFNVHHAGLIHGQIMNMAPGNWNHLEPRPLEGFVFAVSPFNFLAIGSNLPTAPAMLGNVVLWKPSSSVVFSNHFLLKLWAEAGLPPGVINFLPGPGDQVGAPVLAQPSLAGLHFTGSTDVFREMWSAIGRNIGRYRNYPRLVGETGGKGFVMVHASTDPALAATALIRGAFEFQGQKCSATSRAYIPDSLWPQVRDLLAAALEEIKVGDVADLRNFMGAVIDRPAFRRVTGYLEYARTSNDHQIVFGGQADDTRGYFIQPTVIRATQPQTKLMNEEIFGPVLTVYVYPEKDFAETLGLCDQTSPYALTGSIFARDRPAVRRALTGLRYSAGNFYINDKTTGAMVGQQPFGGARASGTNDKVGSILNMWRWVNPRTIKETFIPATDFRYPFLGKGP
ncbi:MAG: L-glutamate gamma-semialdehyde dehydrogenase [Thermodesulfobacteriota bacterium]